MAFTDKQRVDLDALYAKRIKDKEVEGYPFYTVSFSEQQEIMREYFANLPKEPEKNSLVFPSTPSDLLPKG